MQAIRAVKYHIETTRFEWDIEIDTHPSLGKKRYVPAFVGLGFAVRACVRTNLRARVSDEHPPKLRPKSNPNIASSRTGHGRGVSCSGCPTNINTVVVPLVPRVILPVPGLCPFERAKEQKLAPLEQMLDLWANRLLGRTSVRRFAMFDFMSMYYCNKQYMPVNLCLMLLCSAT